MNKQQYQDMQRLVQNLEHRFKDLCDDKNHPVSRSLEQSLRSLEDAFQLAKNPRSIENTVANLEDSFDRLNNPAVMNPEHADYFAGQMKQIKMNLRKFDNY
ncbi:hypothetical protein KY385_03860 [Candidatus Parcubacteria bacterium]|nr:hypothetical protein [Candidatus Parcubacteria bacterium]